MKNLILVLSALVLFSCSDSAEQNNAIVSDGSDTKTQAVTSAPRRGKSTLGGVTELEPEKNSFFKKIILADPFEFKERYDNGASVIDVRSAEDYAAGHISGAINISISDPEFSSKATKLMSTKPILVYSQKGVKSQEATHLLETAGFKKIFNLEGGYDAWLKVGL